MKGCLLIHGYTGDPSEVKPLALHLETLGYQTLCPILPGHGSSRRDLKKATYLEWICSIEESYLQLSKSCDEVAVLGFSMGGLLAFHLARKYSPACLVTMGTPIFCFDIRNLYTDLIYSVITNNQRRLKEYFMSCFTPIGANLNFKKVLWCSKPLIHQIDVPIFVVHGKKDPVAHYRSAHYIYGQSASLKKQVRIYDEMRHRFSYSENTDIIYKDIGVFVQEHLN